MESTTKLVSLLAVEAAVLSSLLIFCAALLRAVRCFVWFGAGALVEFTSKDQSYS